VDDDTKENLIQQVQAVNGKFLDMECEGEDAIQMNR
jgi:hypothetical protein